MVISIQPTIPFFEGNGYDTWSIKMRTLFISEDLWELVDKGYVEEEIPRDAMRDVRKNDAKALFFIQQAISESIFPQISKATKSKEAWDSLQTKYQSTSLDAAQDGDGSQTDIPLMDDSVYEAAAKGDIEALKKIPESEFHAQLSPNHNTILHIASEFGKIECVNWILDFPSSSSLLPLPNLNEDTPFTLQQGKGKDTALHEAVRHGNREVVKLLIKEDPDLVYGANDSGTTPLYMAAEGRFRAIVEIIIDESKETGTSPPYIGFMGRTALHAAVICNDKEMTKTILEWKPDLTKEVDKNGWSPLHYAAERGCDLEIVKLLLEKSEKSVAYLRSKDGKKTALHIASFHHHTKIVEEILSHSPGCREQVDDKGNNIFHFAMMKKGDGEDDFKPSNYFFNKWLESRGLVNEKNAQGNTPIHLLSLNQISDSWFVWNKKVDKKAYNNEDLTAYDKILRADISEKKDFIQAVFEHVMTETSSSFWKKLTKRRERKKERKEYISQLQKQGETHLIVSALITTVTFAAGFTLPGGYKEDDGQAILSKKAAFRAFVVTDTIAMVSSLCAVFLHFFMTMHKRGKYLEKHLLWAFILTMVGMGAMAIAFATGLYAVLPSCFFLSIAVEYCKFWRGTISDFIVGWVFRILQLIFE
ncbi:hypothetical protein AAG906_020928 [Vitis piasezkii]